MLLEREPVAGKDALNLSTCIQSAWEEQLELRPIEDLEDEIDIFSYEPIQAFACEELVRQVVEGR